MGWWRVSADVLAQSRFLVSALVETVGCLLTLHRANANPGERAWLDTHLPAYRERLDPIAERLVGAAFGRGWIADFLTLPPLEGGPTFADELAQIRRVSPDEARANLMVSLRGPLPAELDRDDLVERAAELLDWVWRETVEPDWPRRRRILEADIVARTTQLSQAGWAAALGGMRNGMRWLGEGRLQINTYDYPPMQVTGARLLFVPATQARGWVAWDGAARFALIYPCTGVLAESDHTPTEEPLARLLGPGRSAVFLLLETPKSTTQLVALTGQGLGSVGRHLKILLDANLVRRRRAGRSVLYYRSDAGETLVRAQTAMR
jgi:DNA-binding transcriptional ArsR family regulator